MIRPIMVMILIDANQNSHSPKARVPRKLMMITTTAMMVIQAALLMVSFQSMSTVSTKRNERRPGRENPHTIDQDGGGGQLGGKGDDPSVPIIPAKNRTTVSPNGDNPQ